MTFFSQTFSAINQDIDISENGATKSSSVRQNESSQNQDISVAQLQFAKGTKIYNKPTKCFCNPSQCNIKKLNTLKAAYYYMKAFLASPSEEAFEGLGSLSSDVKANMNLFKPICIEITRNIEFTPDGIIERFERFKPLSPKSSTLR